MSERLPTESISPSQYDCSFPLMTQLYIIWETRCGGSCVKGITHVFWGSSRRLWLIWCRNGGGSSCTANDIIVQPNESLPVFVFTFSTINHESWVSWVTEIYSFIIHFGILLAFGFGPSFKVCTAAQTRTSWEPKNQWLRSLNEMIS